LNPSFEKKGSRVHTFQSAANPKKKARNIMNTGAKTPTAAAMKARAPFDFSLLISMSKELSMMSRKTPSLPSFWKVEVVDEERKRSPAKPGPNATPTTM